MRQDSTFTPCLSPVHEMSDRTQEFKPFKMPTHYSSTDMIYHEPSCSLHRRRVGFFFIHITLILLMAQWVITPGMIMVSESSCCWPHRWFSCFDFSKPRWWVLAVGDIKSLLLSCWIVCHRVNESCFKIRICMSDFLWRLDSKGKKKEYVGKTHKGFNCEYTCKYTFCRSLDMWY